LNATTMADDDEKLDDALDDLDAHEDLNKNHLAYGKT
jgi:ribosome assembly protein YihI (activator of Der GTPase)